MNDWMSRLSDDYKNKKINNIFLPGSHDSSAYVLDLSIPIKDGTFEKIRKYGKIISPLLEKWTITQSYDIYNQLKNGIRYLDIRISELNNKFYTSHSFACIEFKIILDQINKFSLENKTEIIIIDITLDNYNKNLYKNNDGLSNLINDHDIYKLCYNTTNDEIPTYNEMIKRGTPLILLIDNEMKLDKLNRLTYNKRFKNWTNSQTNCDNTLRTLLNITSIIDINDYDKIMILEETLTPSDNEVIMSFLMHIIFHILYICTCIIFILVIIKQYEHKNVAILIVLTILILIILQLVFRNTYDSLKTMSKEVHGTLTELLKNNIKLKKNINVLTGDFITSDFCKIVCDLNI